MIFLAAVLAASQHLTFAIPVTKETPAKVEFVTQSRRWTAKLTPPVAKFDVDLPKDNTLTIVAEHFDPFVVTADTTTIRLHPQPLLTGRVLDVKSGKGTPGAAIERPDGKLLAITSGDGAFRAYVADEWPAAVVVHATGRARNLVKLPSRRADTTLPPIELRPSASADVIIDNRDALPRTLHWQAAIRYAGGNPDVLERGELAATATRIHVADLPEGDIAITVAGTEPLQKYGVLFALRDGDAAEQHVRIQPATLTVRVRMGDEPLRDADVELLNWATRWSARLRTGDDGNATAEFWQSGEYAAGVRAESLASPFLDSAKTIDSARDATLDIVVPDRRILATVVTPDGKPVVHAFVTLFQMVNGNRMRVAQYTNDRGIASFRAARAGRSWIDVTKEGFAPPDTIAFEVPETEHERALTITLPDGAARTLTVVDMTNTPLAGATIFHASNDGVRALGVTASDGTLSLGLKDPAAGVVFAVPPAGGFAFVRLASVDGDAVKLVVPPLVSTLQIRTVTTGGDAIPNVTFAVQFNGMLLPLEVLREMQRLHGATFATNAAGAAWLANLPAGYYELFPLQDAAAFNRLFANSAADAAAKVQVNRGEQTVVVRLK